MKDLIRTLDDYVKIVNRMNKYGYIGNIEERVEGGAIHFSPDYIVTLIKTGNVEPTVIKRDSDEFPYQLEVSVGTHTLYCLLRQREYDTLIKDGILTEGLLRDEIK